MIGEEMDVAIDLGKWKSYVVVQENGKVVDKGYVETSEYGFSTVIGETKGANVIVEASGTLGRVAAMLKGQNVIVAHPLKVKLIAESVRKTDKIDSNVLLDLYNAVYLPKAYLPSQEVIQERDLCRNRHFLVRQRTALKNRIRFMMFQNGIEFRNFNKKNNRKLDAHPVLKVLRQELDSLEKRIKTLGEAIGEVAYRNRSARLIYTVPGIGRIGALTLASEIADINRFPTEFNLSSYAGLVPRIYQSGSKEWRGHIVHGNNFIKHILVECVQIHFRKCPHSPITMSYRRIKLRAGHKKAVVAAARRMLRVIYYMLKRDESYHPDEEKGPARRWSEHALDGAFCVTRPVLNESQNATLMADSCL